MNVSSPDKSQRLPSIVQVIMYALLTIVLSCGCCYLLFYLYLNWPYIRGGFVASQAQARVDPIYQQMLDMIPNGTTLVSEEKPQSGTYSFSLSDGAPRNAFVRAQQNYTTAVGFSEVLTTYEDQLTQAGWVTLPLSTDSTAVSIAFRHPNDENLIVGLCSPVEANLQSNSAQYIIFFDFDETGDCEGRSTRLGCVAAHYCE
jgi:hypothetical protein